MTRLRAIGQELVERKLWPVVVVLVIAAVGLPLALGGGGGETVAPSAPATGSAPANAQPAAVVSLTGVTASGKRNRKGSVRDPFVQQHVVKLASQTAAAGGSTSGGSGPMTNLTPSSPLDSNYGANPVAGDDTGSGTTTPVVPGTTQPSGSNVYHAVIRIKHLGKESYLHDAARYDYVPSKTQRYMLFLGVLADRRTAVFSMVTSGYLYGNARCRPARRFCSTIEMRPGTTELMTVPHADGSVTRVRITLVRIFAKKVKKAGTKASAKSAKGAQQSYRAAFIR